MRPSFASHARFEALPKVKVKSFLHVSSECAGGGARGRARAGCRACRWAVARRQTDRHALGSPRRTLSPRRQKMVTSATATQ